MDDVNAHIAADPDAGVGTRHLHEACAVGGAGFYVLRRIGFRGGGCFSNRIGQVRYTNDS
jgi:hypothetical protein